MRLKSLALAVAVSVAAGGVSAQQIDLTLSGGNPGGLWSLLGAGMDRAGIASRHNRSTKCP